jgi:folate-dependent phosphoribosylglycinamide formyltransferase PurN
MRDQIFHVRRNEQSGYSDRDHVVAAAQWLARAQDATGDGGVSGRYSLRSGWSSSYPETTGYIVPTFISLAKEIDHSFLDRAAESVKFLRATQLSDGAFPGGELHENRTRPSVFNTAQILHGLVAWHAETGDIDAAEAASRAAEWLVSQQDADGSWRRNIYNTVTSYSAHASCWLAEAGRHFGVEDWTRSAERHLDWVLTNVDHDTGWIDRAGFAEEDHEKRRAVTHTIAYTIWGLLHLSDSLGREDGIAVARRAADAVARRLELAGKLPGVLDSRWRAVTNEYACMTGNAQMALIWFRLAMKDGDTRFVNAGLKALDLVKAAQPMDNADPGIRGGIPGSAPAWGNYLYMALPNWAAKYFIDAMFAKERALEWVSAHDDCGWTAPRDIARTVAAPIRSVNQPARVVMLSSPDSHKVPQMMKAWADWGFRPSAVVIEHRRELAARDRIRKRLLQDGFLGPLRASFVQRSRSALARTVGTDTSVDVAAFCEAEKIPILHVGPLSDADSTDAVRQLEPDILVHAGAGILRRAILSTPKLGTLNAHMGILPRYRGMNVAEWSRLEGSHVGCTVHLINEGIDTGDIIAVSELDTSSATSIFALRALVDEAQIALLGRAVRFIVETGALPPTRAQSPSEGRQYFEMHPELRRMLERRLAERRKLPDESSKRIKTERVLAAR